MNTLNLIFTCLFTIHILTPTTQSLTQSDWLRRAHLRDTVNYIITALTTGMLGLKFGYNGSISCEMVNLKLVLRPLGHSVLGLRGSKELHLLLSALHHPWQETLIYI